MRTLIGVALGVAVLAAVVAVGLGGIFPGSWSCPTVVTYDVAGFDVAETRRLALMAGAVALVVLAAALARRAWIRAHHGAFVALTFAVVAGICALFPLYLASTLFIRHWVYTAVDGDTGRRELIVREWSLLLGGGGEVLERDGILLERIARIATDDGQTAFHDGAYEVTRDGDLITLTWDFGGTSSSMVLPPAGERADTADGCASRSVLY